MDLVPFQVMNCLAIIVVQFGHVKIFVIANISHPAFPLKYRHMIFKYEIDI